MTEIDQKEEILKFVGKALLDKGAEYSVGKLVAELEGDGMTDATDPFNVWDEHFYQDLTKVDDWPDEPRDLQEVNDLLDTFETYWEHHPDKRFCQIVCNANAWTNGIGDYPEDAIYKVPLDELTDDELQSYLERRITRAQEEVDE